MSQTIKGVRWTIQDIEVLPENEGIRYEIIDGALFPIRSPHHKHQQTTGRAFAAFAEDILTSPLLQALPVQ